ncbi:MAG: SDR family oxidoreductase, partial [Actinomycetota bacterium]|nr:SDR family oxidoreductase [Actinomycetota bacterium]
MNLNRLHFDTALVTGASSGIGRTFAEHLAKRGCDLVLVARRADRLEQLAGDLRAGHGRRIEVLAADLTEPEQLALVEERLATGQPAVDLLVNNAGFGTQGAFVSLPLETEERMIRLHVLAPVRLTRAALPPMIERGRGAVLNVSSIAGLQPLPYNATYAATKSYLTTFSLSVHEEVRDQGVQVMALMPGFTHTEFHDEGRIEKTGEALGIWKSADTVVAAALRDLDRGWATSVPGFGYRVFA